MSEILSDYDAILIVGFGGPEGPEDVIPFLENVLRGRNVPRERMLEVAEHYQHFGGVSPINGQVRDLIAALTPELRSHGVNLPIYWGNRNWHPMLAYTMRKMTDDGIKHALAVVHAAYSSYSSCRQYREDVQKAREVVGENAPVVDKMRVFYNHPDFVASNASKLKKALDKLPTDAHIAFTAHSIPASMAANCRYETQLTETSRLIAESLGISPDRWKLVYQSRSGRPQDPWLEPDILDHLQDLHHRGIGSVAIDPIGFLSDHMEVMYDLDDEARKKADALGMTMERAETVGIDPQFVSMLRELIVERITHQQERKAIGEFPASHDVCPIDCCLPPPRPAARPEPPTAQSRS